MILGKVLCKSPDPLTVIQVGRWDIRHREYRLAVRALSDADQQVLRGLLHVLPRTKLVDNEWVTADELPGPEERRVLERLWRILAQRGHLHPQTQRGSTGVV